MANGYTRQSAAQIQTNNTIQASDFNNEFDALQQAFDLVLGHTHDTSVPGNGGPIIASSISTASNIRQVSLMAYGPLTACTYANGTLGVGATLTANSNGTLTIAGQSVAVNQRIFLAGQSGLGGTGIATNGIYTVTSPGSAGSKWQLTRATDFNSSSNIFDGIAIYIADDLYFSYSVWQLSCASPVVVGTTALNFNATATVNNFAGAANLWKSSIMYLQPIGASVYLSANSAITLNTWTKIPFDTIEYDISQAGITNTGGVYFDKTTNHRYTPTPVYTLPSSTDGTAAPTVPGLPGYYSVRVTATLAAGTTIGAGIYKNGSAVRQTQIPGPGTVTCSGVVHLNGSTDYVEGFAFSSSTTNMNGGTGPTPSWMDITYIGSNVLFT